MWQRRQCRLCVILKHTKLLSKLPEVVLETGCLAVPPDEESASQGMHLASIFALEVFLSRFIFAIATVKPHQCWRTDMVAAAARPVRACLVPSNL